MYHPNEDWGIRTNVHRDLVQESTVGVFKYRNDNKGLLRFHEPVVVTGDSVGFLCCESGLPISVDGDTIIRYQHLSLNELVVIHKNVVINKGYTFIKQFINLNLQTHGIL